MKDWEWGFLRLVGVKLHGMAPSILMEDSACYPLPLQAKWGGSVSPFEAKRLEWSVVREFMGDCGTWLKDLGTDSCLETSEVHGSLHLHLKQALWAATVEVMVAVLSPDVGDSPGQRGPCGYATGNKIWSGGTKQPSGEWLAYVKAWVYLRAKSPKNPQLRKRQLWCICHAGVTNTGLQERPSGQTCVPLSLSSPSHLLQPWKNQKVHSEWERKSGEAKERNCEEERRWCSFPTAGLWMVAGRR